MTDSSSRPTRQLTVEAVNFLASKGITLPGMDIQLKGEYVLPGKTEVVPTPEQISHSKTILELVLRGIDPDDIVKITGLPKPEVDKIILSEWFDKETRERAKEAKGDPETLRGLMRVQAFRATVKLGRLLDSKSEQIQLSAIKVALEYAIKPARLVDMKKDADSVSLDSIQREKHALEVELAALNRKLSPK